MNWFILQSITFNGFVIQAGNDASGVATEMVTMNSTVKFVFRNTGTFFGVHVASAPVDLFYYELSLASGNVSPANTILSLLALFCVICSSYARIYIYIYDPLAMIIVR